MNGDYSWLDSYEGDYRPQQPFRMGLEALPDGDYDFLITDAAFDEVKGDRILRIGLKTIQGSVVEWTRWLNQQNGINALAADLVVLGFDADKWGSQQRPLSRELPAAVAKLPGIRFRAHKSTRTGTGANAGKNFQNLHLAGRISGAPMPPASPVNSAPVPVNPPFPTVGAEEIPF